MIEIKQNIAVIRKRILVACNRSGRPEEAVKLLLATKTVPAENIRIALEAGETLVGENKVQEVKSKYDFLKTIPHETHFIGHLQTNKVAEILKYATCIQSVDRMSLVQKLDQQLLKEGRSMDVFLQVNTSNEASKFGADPSEIHSFAREVSRYDTLKVRGLMTIGLFSAEEEKVRECFRLLREIKLELVEEQLPNFTLEELSMGMSGDMETAIEEGATLIRVGTAIFGQRSYPDSYYWNEDKEVR